MAQKKNILLRNKYKKAQASLESGRYEEAWVLSQELCRADRLDPQPRLMCGVIAGLRGDNETAEAYCRQALALDPALATAHFNLGVALRSQKRFTEACQSFKRATELQKNYREGMVALAHAYISLYDWSNAAQVLTRILSIWPNDAPLQVNLGTVYQAMGRLREAVAAYEAASKLNPRLGGVLSSLGSAYLGLGDFERAEICLRRSLAADPADLRARSNLLMLLNYRPDVPADTVFAEHLEYGRIIGNAVPAMDPPEVAPDPLKRLRVGYLSADFREHSVAAYIEPILSRHDHVHFEIFCYSYLPTPDATTERLKSFADVWRDIDALSDAEVVQRVRDDKIDILIDLAGHTGHNRLAVFAARPTPLQMTYLGYPNTTGLRTIDYRITDGVTDPVGEEAFHSEKLLRLEGCFLCYQPDPAAPEVASLPAPGHGYVTFGSFNNYSKINRPVLQLWADVLGRVSGSRLLLKCPALTDAHARERIAEDMLALGIAAERLELLGHTPTREAHLALYGRIDIALDTFPYNGTTTTCEALWMGVPVVTLAGQRHAGRVGASLLNAAGHPEWIADSPVAYAETAAGLAADLDRLQAIRAGLRQQLLASRLCDAESFTRGIESAYRSMWRNWCDARAQ